MARVPCGTEGHSVPLLPSGPGRGWGRGLRRTLAPPADAPGWGRGEPRGEGRARWAEREGFEPSVPVKVHTLSRRAPSTTRAPLRTYRCGHVAARSLVVSRTPSQRRGGDSNPRYHKGIHDFESCRFNRAHAPLRRSLPSTRLPGSRRAPLAAADGVATKRASVPAPSGR